MPKRSASKPAVKPAVKPARHSTTISFATNREKLSEGFGKDAAEGKAGARQLWLGQVEISWVGDPIETEAPRQLLRAPAIDGDDDFKDPDHGACARVLDGWLAGAAARGALPLLFIHGFANSFSDAMQRAAQIEEFYADAKLDLAILAFSWPSDGQVIDLSRLEEEAGVATQYLDDQRDATAAGPAVARLLREVWRARQRAGAPRLALLAHSMGNHALASGLAAMNNGLLTRELGGLFAQALLVAADVESTCFEPGQPMRLLPQLAERVCVLTSQDTTLSKLSKIANGNRRLGHYGPASLAGLPEAVQVVDCFAGLDWGSRDRILAKGGTEWDVVQHQWYRNDVKARAAIAALLSGAAPPFTALEAALQTEAERSRHALLA
ncbi:alpha/beta hydrolase [Falsiroseomonas selenitidurans]|uniref:Alpha/beta hydrolase n=1 Tax=Falsiroseomonas selenitidurans TaxID=2716335 RepID=A0ABX1E178_9PROT|nr:alpha/beta hydrolase [Falsiroseomonas selenitidurans]NKC29287.1 alpha/beta hydrolase [Falsiroseomonas selenitidurans]